MPGAVSGELVQAGVWTLRFGQEYAIMFSSWYGLEWPGKAGSGTTRRGPDCKKSDYRFVVTLFL